MSRRTRSVAVAVKAWNDDVREIVAQPSELPVLGRKSWPHWLMQCASSMAMKRDAALLQQPAEALAALADQPLGRHVQQPAAILAQARQDRVALARSAACCSRYAAATPSTRRPST